jgi:transcription initiation factor TFIIIB Brf1 subunit/transcription initiation factor TFIIB
MPYCPKCKYDYEKWVKECPDCGVVLVAGSAPEEVEGEAVDSDDQEDAVLLAQSDNSMQIEFLLDVLDEQGIPYYVSGNRLQNRRGTSDISSVASASNLLPGSIKLFVAREDYGETKEIWDSLQGAELTEDIDTFIEEN